MTEKSSYIISGSRTPIGAFLGGLSSLTACDLGAVAIQDCLRKASIENELCEVLMGNVLQAGVGQAPARQAALKAGLSAATPCVTINKVCGSGLKAVMLADQAIRVGDASQIIAGGMESMSQAPHFAGGLRTGTKLGDIQLVDSMVHDGLTCAFESCHMGTHAEYIANKFGISREDQDEFSARSQSFAAEAVRQKLFSDEIVPVTVSSRKGDVVVSADECVRGDTTVEGLSKLRPVFDREGTVTAGNASTLSDGAASVAVVNEQIAKKRGAEAFKIVGSATSGVDPRDLFIAPVSAIQKVSEKTGVSLDAIDFFEINEAFASQMVACVQEAKIDANRVNVNGGSISLGHPIGASGARCLVTLIHVLKRNEARLGMVSLCLGGGNAVAMLVERVTF